MEIAMNELHVPAADALKSIKILAAKGLLPKQVRFDPHEFLSIVQQAVAEERESCAEIAKAYCSENNGMIGYLTKEQINDVTCGAIAAAIRARGEE